MKANRIVDKGGDRQKDVGAGERKIIMILRVAVRHPVKSATGNLRRGVSKRRGDNENSPVVERKAAWGGINSSWGNRSSLHGARNRLRGS